MVAPSKRQRRWDVTLPICPRHGQCHTQPRSDPAGAIQDDANDVVVGSLAGISGIVEHTDETQAVIGGVLTEQTPVTKDIPS